MEIRPWAETSDLGIGFIPTHFIIDCAARTMTEQLAEETRRHVWLTSLDSGGFKIVGNIVFFELEQDAFTFLLTFA